jgi:hypothetical protein
MAMINVNIITNIRISIVSNKNSSYCFFAKTIGHSRVLMAPAVGSRYLDMNIIRCKVVRFAHMLKHLKN